MAYEINSALARLEQNLKNVDSARKQVESVVSESKELQEVVKAYSDNLNSIYDELVTWEKELTERSGELSDSYKAVVHSLNASCKEIVDSFKESGAAVSKQFGENVRTSLSELDDSNKQLVTSIESLASLYSDFKNALTDVLSIKAVLVSISDDFNDSQNKQDQALEIVQASVAKLPETLQSSFDLLDDSVSKLKQTVDNIHSAIDVATKSLSTKIEGIQTKMLDELHSVHEEIKINNKDLRKQTMLNMCLLIAGLVIMLVLKFV